MKQKMKRILSVALVMCLVASVFFNIPVTAQAASYKKTIKKTIKLKGYEAKALKFKTNANANLTVTAKVKNASKPTLYQSVTMFCEGEWFSAYFTNPKKLSKKMEFEKGTHNLIITSAAGQGQDTITLTIEIKAKKSALKFISLKKTHVRKGSSSDDEK